MLKKIMCKYWEDIKTMPKTMKITSILLILIIILMVFHTNCVSPNKAYVKQNYDNGELMLPDLINYIEADKKLTKLDKEVRKKAIVEWLKLNKTMYDRMEGGK